MQKERLRYVSKVSPLPYPHKFLMFGLWLIKPRKYGQSVFHLFYCHLCKGQASPAEINEEIYSAAKSSCLYFTLSTGLVQLRTRSHPHNLGASINPFPWEFRTFIPTILFQDRHTKFRLLGKQQRQTMWWNQTLQTSRQLYVTMLDVNKFF